MTTQKIENSISLSVGPMQAQVKLTGIGKAVEVTGNYSRYFNYETKDSRKINDGEDNVKVASAVYLTITELAEYAISGKLIQESTGITYVSKNDYDLLDFTEACINFDNIFTCYRSRSTLSYLYFTLTKPAGLLAFQRILKLCEVYRLLVDKYKDNQVYLTSDEHADTKTYNVIYGKRLNFYISRKDLDDLIETNSQEKFVKEWLVNTKVKSRSYDLPKIAKSESLRNDCCCHEEPLSKNHEKYTDCKDFKSDVKPDKYFKDKKHHGCDKQLTKLGEKVVDLIGKDIDVNINGNASYSKEITENTKTEKLTFDNLKLSIHIK